MDPVRNPYVPNAGARPPALPGRDDLIADFAVALQRVKIGKTAKGILPYGLRGVGKTVLLLKFVKDAAALGYLTVSIEVDDDKPFLPQFANSLRRVLFELDTPARVNALAKRALRIFKSFALKCGLDGISMNIDVDPERGYGDTGDLATDLTELLVAVGEAAREQETAVLIAVDEVQYLKAEQFGAIIAAMHKVNQEELPVLFVATGLPQVLALAGDAKSYAERIFDFRLVGPLSPDETREAVIEPARGENVVFESEAADAIVEATRGYPYFIQEWAYRAWNVAAGPSITLDDVRHGERLAVPKLDAGFFEVRYKRCSASERRYLRAMAELGPGPYRSADIAAFVKKSQGALGPTRDALIKKGMIWSPDHGELAFTVPLFDEFMRRKEPSPSSG